MGCTMMRKCHLNTCPVGVATQVTFLTILTYFTSFLIFVMMMVLIGYQCLVLCVASKFKEEREGLFTCFRANMTTLWKLQEKKVNKE
jgi:hypothetical protein